jgi:hypothetical protein
MLLLIHEFLVVSTVVWRSTEMCRYQCLRGRGEPVRRAHIPKIDE